MRIKPLAIGVLTLICLTTALTPRTGEPETFTLNPDGSKTFERGADSDVKLTLSVSTEITTVAPPPSVTLPLFSWSDIFRLLELAGAPFTAWLLRKWRNRRPIPGVVSRPLQLG